MNAAEKKRGKFRRLMAALAAAVCLLAPTGAWAGTIDMSRANAQVVIEAGSGDVTLTGTGGFPRGSAVLVQSGYKSTITLDGVKIAGTSEAASNAIEIESGASPDIVLVGDNTLTGVMGNGLKVPVGAEVRISGTGKLTAANATNPYAGIGGASSSGGVVTPARAAASGAGIITIAGGHVAAMGFSGSSGASAGIGGDLSEQSGSGGNVTITGGIVEARAGTDNAQDIGKGQSSSSEAGTTTIVGGSVKLHHDRVDNPVNAYGTTVEKVEKILAAALAGKTLAFGVADGANPSYTYTFDVPADGTAYLWVPNAFKNSVSSAVASVVVSAAGETGGVVLAAAATGGTPTAYEWYRSDAADGTFAKIDGATGAAYTDTNVTAGTAYYYRALPFGVLIDTAGSLLAASAASLPQTDGPPLTLASLSVAPGTLTPAFDPATEKYSVELAYDVESITVSAAAASPDRVTLAINDTAPVNGAVTLPLAVGVNGVAVTLTDKSDDTRSRTYEIAVTRGTRLIPEAESPSGVSAFLVESGLPGGITPIASIPAGSTVQPSATPGASVTSDYQPSGVGSIAIDMPAGAGEGLGLAFCVDASALGASFDNWPNKSGDERLALILDLEKQGFSVVYEYANVPGRTYAVLVGDGLLTWTQAVDAGIVRLDAAGIALNYVVVDGAEDPYVSGAFVVLPDGVTDGRLIDPLWFMHRKQSDPGGSSGGGVGCASGAGALALFGLGVALMKKRR